MAGTRGIRALRKVLGEIHCPTCLKKAVVLNLAGYKQQQRPEPVSPKTHCTCPGGPAHQLTKLSS
jgi:hypothetical protein